MRLIEAYAEAVLATPDPESFVTARTDRIEVDLGGIPGDRHYGLMRPADVRYKHLYPRGTMIANRRQISLVSVEDNADVAGKLGVEAIMPEWLGANVLISGCPEFTLLPRGARLLFESGASLICEGENEPCIGPGEVIAEHCGGDAKLAARFVKTAQQRRGIVCSVELPGTIAAGDKVRIVLP
ncbi:MOSC domain-containing protein [Cohnella lubricantis]|nr:MOSC domain-containing protein [Cohnella lubricantis]MBP2119457.1 hypothetical protein [Cohnella lubricantis]